MNEAQQNLFIAYRILLQFEEKPFHITVSVKNPHAHSIFITPEDWQKPTTITTLNPSCILEKNINDMVDNTILCHTSHQIHQKIHQQHPHIQAILQVGSPEISNISRNELGLWPCSQWAMILYKRIIYCAFDTINVASNTIANNKKNIIIRDHSVLICENTLWSCVLLWWHLHNACKVQDTLQKIKLPFMLPDHQTCVKAAYDLLHFEKDLGWRDWLAWKRLLQQDQHNPALLFKKRS